VEASCWVGATSWGPDGGGDLTSRGGRGRAVVAAASQGPNGSGRLVPGGSDSSGLVGARWWPHRSGGSIFVGGPDLAAASHRVGVAAAASRGLSGGGSLVGAQIWSDDGDSHGLMRVQIGRWWWWPHAGWEWWRLCCRALIRSGGGGLTRALWWWWPHRSIQRQWRHGCGPPPSPL
jgi:hypothetical protein